MTDYSNWKVLKSIYNYVGNDEIKINQSEMAKEEYSNAADWCNENQLYVMSQDELYYKVKYVGPIILTNDEIRQLRENAYVIEVDKITAHIQRLRDSNPMTPEIETEINDLIIQRNAKFEEIQNRYPYNEESNES